MIYHEKSSLRIRDFKKKCSLLAYSMPKTSLPYFRVICPGFLSTPKNNKNMSSTEIPIKPKRKKNIDVPIHNSNKPEMEGVHKIYGAQFSTRRKHKHKSNELKESSRNNPEFNNPIDNYGKLGPNLEIVEAEVNKIKKKTLIESHERIYTEYQQLLEQMSGSEENHQRKIAKLKDKLSALQKVNENVVVENTQMKEQQENLLFTLDEYKVQLENSKHCGRCEELQYAVEVSASETEALKSTNKQLLEDMDMLKNVVYRLNVQMERYQEKLRKDNTKFKPLTNNQINESYNNSEVINNENLMSLPEDHSDHPHIPISWGSVNSHTLAPLLNSYQETINEKNQIIQHYETEISNVSSKLREIMDENESLHKRLTIDDECSVKLKEELSNINLELKNTKSHNDLLIKKCSLKQDKLEEVLRCYEQKVEQSRRDYSVVMEQYHKSRSEVAALKEKNKSLVEFQDEFKQEREKYIPIAVHNSSVNECKLLYEELKRQYESEKIKLVEKAEIFHKQVEDLTSSIDKLKNEKENLIKKIETYEKQVKKFEGKSLDLKQSLQEVLLSRTACRKQLHKAMEFAKELVSEQEALVKALQHRQQENKAVKQIGSDMASRMDTLKSKLKVVQRDAYNELSSVEQRIKDQDAMIMHMKNKHEEEIARLQQVIKEKEENLLIRTGNSSIPNPPYLLLRDRNLNY